MRNRPAEFLQHRSNFIQVAGWGFGVPFGIWGLWQFGAYGSIGLWLFLIALTVLVAWLWAFGMWFVCGSDIQRIAKASEARGDDAKPGA